MYNFFETLVNKAGADHKAYETLMDLYKACVLFTDRYHRLVDKASKGLETEELRRATVATMNYVVGVVIDLKKENGFQLPRFYDLKIADEKKELVFDVAEAIAQAEAAINGAKTA